MIGLPDNDPLHGMTLGMICPGWWSSTVGNGWAGPWISVLHERPEHQAVPAVPEKAPLGEKKGRRALSPMRTGNRRQGEV